MERATLILSLVVEGMSIRFAERITSHHRDTITRLLVLVTTGTFQLEGYDYAVRMHLWGRVDYAMLIKQYGSDPEGQRRYSPPRIIGQDKRFMSRYPDPAKVCTSHIERQNLTMRMQLRRLTRLTNGFSKKWENLKAALALHFAHYNLCRIHSSIRMTPAMKANVLRGPWTMAEYCSLSREASSRQPGASRRQEP